MEQFILNRDVIRNHERVTLIEDLVPINEYLDDIEKFINICFVETGYKPVQHGRVVALRATDRNRLVSAFKSAAYLGRYNDMDNITRFMKMVSAGHSYEPIRGESFLFLYIGVGKPVYDHIITYSVGRTTRIAGGQRANLPWGYEIPIEARNPDMFKEAALAQIETVVNTVKGAGEFGKEQIQAARSLLPVGYIMPPFLFEFSEEALVHIFTQRLWESGAQGATVDVISDMCKCVFDFDFDKWSQIYEYHGPHIVGWKKAMRTIRDKEISIGKLLDMAQDRKAILLDTEYSLYDIGLYDIIMKTVGTLPKSMWDKQK